jgi:adenine nucleotide transporter 17
VLPQFTAFDQARRRLLSGAAAGRAELSAAEAFVLGAASKALATALTYPAIRTKVLMQTMQGGGGDAGGAHPPGLLATARAVARREGAAGLYRGLRAQLLKTVLVAALQLMVKEKSFGAAYLAVAHVQEARLKAAARRTKSR